MTCIVKEIKRGCPPKKIGLKFWIVFDNGAWYSGEPHPPLSAMVSICHTPAPPLLAHCCTIFLKSSGYRNIAQGGDPIYAGVD